MLPFAGPTAAADAGRLPSDAVALAVCVIDADLDTAAIVHLQRGAAQSAALAAIGRTLPDERYRAQARRRVAEVYRQRPLVLRGYVGAQLRQCAAQAAAGVDAAAADGCYQLTRFANDFFAARAAGIARDDAIAALREMTRDGGLSADGQARLARLAASVYATTVDAPDFRAGLFFHCLRPAEGTR